VASPRSPFHSINSPFSWVLARVWAPLCFALPFVDGEYPFPSFCTLLDPPFLLYRFLVERFGISEEVNAKKSITKRKTVRTWSWRGCKTEKDGRAVRARIDRIVVKEATGENVSK
jgi:hypothetical protein